AFQTKARPSSAAGSSGARRRIAGIILPGLTEALLRTPWRHRRFSWRLAKRGSAHPAVETEDLPGGVGHAFVQMQEERRGGFRRVEAAERVVAEHGFPPSGADAGGH